MADHSDDFGQRSDAVDSPEEQLPPDRIEAGKIARAADWLIKTTWMVRIVHWFDIAPMSAG